MKIAVPVSAVDWGLGVDDAPFSVSQVRISSRASSSFRDCDEPQTESSCVKCFPPERSQSDTVLTQNACFVGMLELEFRCHASYFHVFCLLSLSPLVSSRSAIVLRETITLVSARSDNEADDDAG